MGGGDESPVPFNLGHFPNTKYEVKSSETNAVKSPETTTEIDLEKVRG